MRVFFRFLLIYLYAHVTTFSFAQNVGIGTTAPEGKLHIRGAGDTTQLIIDAHSTQSNTHPLIKLRNSDGSDMMWIHSDDTSNVFIGLKAGRANVIGPQGVNNTFIGSRAGFSNTNGRDNTVLGMNAFASNTKASWNTAIGTKSLFTNTTASQNTAIGSRALFTQSFSNGDIPWNSNNVAVGYEALYSNQPTTLFNGLSNTAVGTSAMRANTIGFNNTANGYRALYSNTTGYSNTATGFFSLYNTTIGRENTAHGQSALYNNTTGNFNTAIGMYALFNNVAGSESTAIGYNAMLNANNNSNAPISQSVAVGFEALRGSSTPADNIGVANTAMGYRALWSNSSGNGNTATGRAALLTNSTGFFNTAIGYYTLYLNSMGTDNTAAGSGALYSNTTASQNTAIGCGALLNQSYSNSGTAWNSNNVAVGYEALFSNQPISIGNGNQNTAIGTFASRANTSGYDNTSLGFNALNNNTIGHHNTAVGTFAGNDLNNRSYNTIIGSYAHVGLSSNNCIAIGVDAFTNVSNVALLGNTTNGPVGGYANWTNFSDGRFKTGIQENVIGLDFIRRLRPVTYHMDINGLHNFWGISGAGDRDANMHQQDAIIKKEAISMTGFVAQEVEQAAQDSGYDFDGVVKPAHDKDHYRISYASFVVPLVKAVQEQQQMINALTKSNQELHDRVRAMSTVENLKAENEKLLQRIEKLEASARNN